MTQATENHILLILGLFFASVSRIAQAQCTFALSRRSSSDNLRLSVSSSMPHNLMPFLRVSASIFTGWVNPFSVCAYIPTELNKMGF